MSFDHTVTIINNSGKVISTGKHLLGIFKEARTAYREKKDALRQEKAGGSRHTRAFQGSTGGFAGRPFVEEFDDGAGFDEGEHGYRALGKAHQPLFLEGDTRLPQNDGGRRSRSLSQSQYSHQSRRSSIGDSSYRSGPRHGRGRIGHNSPRASRPPLTETNLRTHSEVSAATSVSVPIRPHRHDPKVSSSHASYKIPPSVTGRPDNQSRLAVQAQALTAVCTKPSVTSAPVSRLVSNPSLQEQPIDMHLAYGDIPPDLGSRVDLDPKISNADSADRPGEEVQQKEAEAKRLVDYIESLLDEAQCIHHTAASIIAHLHNSPEAAAAVALTLAELSALLAKLSPAFLGIIKGGSPAVFALLASPQFLIGTSIAVGITVVAFGGWKIVKRATDGRQAVEASGHYQEDQLRNTPQMGPSHSRTYLPSTCPAGGKTSPTVVSDDFDEALVLEGELSSIESWRRGIVSPSGYEDVYDPERGSEAIDVELISPGAMRSRIGDDDGRTIGSFKPRIAGQSRTDVDSQRSSHSHHRGKRHQRRTHDSTAPSEVGLSHEVPSRKSSRVCSDGGVSDGSGYHSRRSENRTGGGSRSGNTNHHSSVSTHTMLADANAVLNKKESGGNMLKQLFKKKWGKENKNRSPSPFVDLN